MNKLVSDFIDNYSQCSPDDLIGLTAKEIEEQILEVNPDETEAAEMAEAVVEFISTPL